MPRWERVLGGAGSEEGRGRVRLARGPPAWTAPPALTGASDWSWASEHSPAETPLVGSPVANLRTFGLYPTVNASTSTAPPPQESSDQPRTSTERTDGVCACPKIPEQSASPSVRRTYNERAPHRLQRRVSGVARARAVICPCLRCHPPPSAKRVPICRGQTASHPPAKYLYIQCTRM